MDDRKPIIENANNGIIPSNNEQTYYEQPTT